MTKIRVTEDALFGGRIRLFQPAPGFGYRTNVDALLLAAFAGEGGRTVRRAVDLGAGVGAVGLALFHLGVADSVTFIERDVPAAELCRQNIDTNDFAPRGNVIIGDLEHPVSEIAPQLVHGATLVVANPPYVAEERDGRSRSRASPRQRARHGELPPFLHAADEVLGRRGRACFVYPAHALLDLCVSARAVGFEPKRLRFVHGKADRPARVALLELARGKPGGLVIMPPLVETTSDGRPTPEIARLVR